jgi:hypothetical protein
MTLYWHTVYTAAAKDPSTEAAKIRSKTETRKGKDLIRNRLHHNHSARIPP